MQMQGEHNRVRAIRNTTNKYTDKVGTSVQQYPFSIGED